MALNSLLATVFNGPGLPFSSAAQLGVLVMAALIFYALYVKLSRPRLPLPPGPRTSFFSSPKLSSPYPWIAYREWKETYGDLVYFKMMGNPMLVVNSYDAMVDLFDKRGDIYSSRPVRTMIRELIGFDYLFSSMAYGKSWKQCRHLFTKYFHDKDRSHYQATQLRHAHILLRTLLHNPQGFRHLIRSSSAGVVLALAYGYEVAGNSDEYVHLADEALKSMGRAGLLGTYYVDYFPFLKHLPDWFPFAQFKRDAKIWRIPVRQVLHRPFDATKQRLKEGKASSCLVADELEKVHAGLSSTDEQTIRNTAATTFAAGSDTVVSAVSSFFLAMANFPDSQRRAQEEVDRVLQGRLPTHADRADLPLVTSICYELLRWNPVTPLVLPRYATIENEYRGYVIPQGTTMYANVWAALHDERYPDPFEFKVDRFLDQAKNAREGINPLPDIVFGFGRRVCAGKELAFDFLWIAVASLLVSYDISKAVDENGYAIDAPIEYTPHLLSHPKDFRCSIRPRSPAAIALIEQTAYL